MADGGGEGMSERSERGDGDGVHHSRNLASFAALRRPSPNMYSFRSKTLHFLGCLLSKLIVFAFEEIGLGERREKAAGGGEWEDGERELSATRIKRCSCVFVCVVPCQL